MHLNKAWLPGDISFTAFGTADTAEDRCNTDVAYRLLPPEGVPGTGDADVDPPPPAAGGEEDVLPVPLAADEEEPSPAPPAGEEAVRLPAAAGEEDAIPAPAADEEGAPPAAGEEEAVPLPPAAGEADATPAPAAGEEAAPPAATGGEEDVPAAGDEEPLLALGGEGPLPAVGEGDPLPGVLLLAEAVVGVAGSGDAVRTFGITAGDAELGLDTALPPAATQTHCRTQEQCGCIDKLRRPVMGDVVGAFAESIKM